MRKLLLTFCCCCFVAGSKGGETPSPLLDGDLIFQDSQSAQCRAIQLATGSRYSHVGIILIEKGKVMVCEAVQPVKMTALSEWIKRGKNNHYVVKRLKEHAKWLNPESISKLKTNAKAQLGKNYDALFGWDDDRIYCSELVWKSYQRALGISLCDKKNLRDFNLSDPEVKRVLKERYGHTIPYDESVVSPADLFDSEWLAIVSDNSRPR